MYLMECSHWSTPTQTQIKNGFYSRGSLVEIGVFDGEDVDGAFITGDAQERGVVAEADAAISNVEIIRTLNKQT